MGPIERLLLTVVMETMIKIQTKIQGAQLQVQSHSFFSQKCERGGTPCVNYTLHSTGSVPCLLVLLFPSIHYVANIEDHSSDALKLMALLRLTSSEKEVS